MIEKYLADMESGNVHKWTQFEDVRSEIHTIIVPFQSIEEIWPKSFEHVHLLPTGPNAWPLTNCSPLLVDVREDDAINSYNDTSLSSFKDLARCFSLSQHDATKTLYRNKPSVEIFVTLTTNHDFVRPKQTRCVHHEYCWFFYVDIQITTSSVHVCV